MQGESGDVIRTIERLGIIPILLPSAPTTGFSETGTASALQRRAEQPLVGHRLNAVTFEIIFLVLGAQARYFQITKGATST